MWIVIKTDKKNFRILHQELKKFIGTDLDFYYPKFKLNEIFSKKRNIKEVNLLGNYVFCFHENFKKKSIIKELKFMKGLKYVLDGYEFYQKDILEFVSKCKEAEDKTGYLRQDLAELSINYKYKFIDGIFKNSFSLV